MRALLRSRAGSQCAPARPLRTPRQAPRRSSSHHAPRARAPQHPARPSLAARPTPRSKASISPSEASVRRPPRRKLVREAMSSTSSLHPPPPPARTQDVSTMPKVRQHVPITIQANEPSSAKPLATSCSQVLRTFAHPPADFGQFRESLDGRRCPGTNPSSANHATRPNLIELEATSVATAVFL